MGLISKTIFILLLGLLVWVSIFQGIHLKTTDDSVHTGTITAIETNGLIFKTTRVYFKTDAQSSQEDNYCLIDKSLIPELEKLQKEKKLVTIKYIDYLLPSMMECKGEEGIIIGYDKE